MERRVRAVGELVGELLARYGCADFQARRDRQEAWEALVEDRLRPFATLGPIKRGIWEIFVADAVTLQELTFRQEELLSQFQARLPEHGIERLKFRIGL